MRFKFACPSCNGKIEADASLSGSQSPCPHCAAPVAIPESRVDAGTTLAGFRLERRLGKGGMGEVFLATQLSVKRQVAVKVLPPGFATNPEAVHRFLQEGRLAAKLDHFNIVTVHEAGEDNGTFYLAMAYIEGESLDQRLKRDKVIPESEALGIIRTIADALAYAWETFQLLHRDLKPANIMVDRRGRVFLMDLGLAKSLGEESGLTLSGAILGTPQYMSPEQAEGLSDLGVPTDVYSLGATLYHLVTGTLPFTADSALRVMHKHVHEPLPPPRSRNPQISEGCSRLVERMMGKEPSRRYGDWRDVIRDTDQVLQVTAPAAAPLGGPPAGTPLPARAAPGARAASAAVNKASIAAQAQEALARQRLPPARKPAVVPAAPATPRHPNWLAIGLVAAVLAVLALLGALAVSRHGLAKVPASQAATTKPSTPAVVLTPGTPAKPVSATTPQVAQAATSPKSAPAPTVSGLPALDQPWTVPDLGLELVWVAPGSFQMGSNCTDIEKPVHAVRLSRGYWIGTYEVTQAEYEAIVDRNPSTFKGPRNPVENVSWNEAAAFCTKLTVREQKAGRLPEGYEYRLPTEAEWEYAARGGLKSQTTSAGSGQDFTYSGSNSVDEVAWYYGNSGDKPLDDSEADDGKRKSNVPSNKCRAHPVGQKQPNELGLYDMSGNVWEWCLDWYDEKYYGRSPTVDPANTLAATGRALRGGGWNFCAGNLQSARRNCDWPGYAIGSLGFRACLAPRVEGR